MSIIRHPSFHRHRMTVDIINQLITNWLRCIAERLAAADTAGVRRSRHVQSQHASRRSIHPQPRSREATR
jgi:hypothetical protein